MKHRGSRKRAKAKQQITCMRKLQYPDGPTAKAAARGIRSRARRNNKHPLGLHAYQCLNCGLWHLGTRPPKNR